jgi:hydrogenase nickel incorporation protein HypA/HybF
MHELGLAQSILDIVSQYIPPSQASAVRSVRIRVGQLSGVVASSLEFCFAAIVGDTAMQNARLVIEEVSATANCPNCNRVFAIEHMAFLCPTCGNTCISVISGSELQVVDIELAEESAQVP